MWPSPMWAYPTVEHGKSSAHTSETCLATMSTTGCTVLLLACHLLSSWSLQGNTHKASGVEGAALWFEGAGCIVPLLSEHTKTNITNRHFAVQTDTLLIRHDRTIRNSLIQVDRERAQFRSWMQLWSPLSMLPTLKHCAPPALWDSLDGDGGQQFMHFMAEAAQIAVVAFALQEMPANGPAHGDKNLWHTRKPRKLSPASLVATFFKHFFKYFFNVYMQNVTGCSRWCVCVSLSLYLSLSFFTNWDSLLRFRKGAQN